MTETVPDMVPENYGLLCPKILGLFLANVSSETTPQVWCPKIIRPRARFWQLFRQRFGHRFGHHFFLTSRTLFNSTESRNQSSDLHRSFKSSAIDGALNTKVQPLGVFLVLVDVALVVHERVLLAEVPLRVERLSSCAPFASESVRPIPGVVVITSYVMPPLDRLYSTSDYALSHPNHEKTSTTLCRSR